MKPFVPKNLSSQALYCTARIEARLSNGLHSVGTSFFFRFSTPDGKGVDVLVTNRHVIEGAVELSLWLHEGAPSAVAGGATLPTGVPFNLVLSQDALKWIDHPSADIDLCAFPMTSVFNEASRVGKHIYYSVFDEGTLPTEEVLTAMSALESVAMIGYPNGLWDDVNNFPLVRRGHTASHPAIDYRGDSIMMIDIAAFGGSSGSPVLILDEGRVGPGVSVGARLYVLGILFAGPQYDVNGELHEIAIPTGTATTEVAVFPMHLGLCIKARELLRLKRRVFEVLAQAIDDLRAALPAI